MAPITDTSVRLLVSSFLLLLLVVGTTNGAMQARTAPRSSFAVRPWGIKQDDLNNKLDDGSSTATATTAADFDDTQSSPTTDNNAFSAQNNTLDSHHLSERPNNNNNAPKIVLMGGPSSGKGTQSHRIVEKYDVVHLSTGDMLREAVAEQTAVGIVAKDFMDAGELVPDEIITKIVLDRIEQPDCLEKGWILDGFPRTRGQAEAMQQLGIIPDLFLFLHVPDSELLERVVGRRTDPVTGTIYHLKFFPPPTDEIRDRLVQRSDDTVEKMENRLRQFHANVDAVRDFYDDVFSEINGLGTPEEIGAGIFRSIDERHVLA